MGENTPKQVHIDSSKPRLATTMIVVRDGRGSAPFQVLAITRSRNLRVLPGFMVFPGGVLDTMDIHIAKQWRSENVISQVGVHRHLLIVPELFPMTDGEFHGEILEISLLYASLVVTGFRELFEETGIYLGNQSLTMDQLASIRSDLFHEEGSKWIKLVLSESGFFVHRYVGRRVTPEQVKFRFDTHYFIVKVPFDTALDPSPDEVESVFWSTAEELLSRFEGGELNMAPPTVDALETLCAYTSMDDLMTGMTLPDQVNDDKRISKFLQSLRSD